MEALPDDVRGPVDDVLLGVPEVVDLVLHALQGQGVVDLLDDLLEAEGLLDEIVGAVLHGHHRGVHGRVARHDDDHGGLAGGLHPLEQLDAVHARQLEVGDHEVVDVLADAGECRLGVFHELQVVVVLFELLEQDLAEIDVVFNYEYMCHLTSDDRKMEGETLSFGVRYVPSRELLPEITGQVMSVDLAAPVYYREADIPGCVEACRRVLTAKGCVCC